MSSTEENANSDAEAIKSMAINVAVVAGVLLALVYVSYAIAG